MKFLDYIRGKRKGKEAHRIEMDAMNDPFVSDAIEGFDSIKGDHIKNIAELQDKVAGRTVALTNKRGAWEIAVAAVALIAILGGYFTLMNHESNMMAAKEKENNYLTLYAPASYIEKKNLELGDIQEGNSGKDAEVNPIVEIVNIDEVIKPVTRINIYVPDTYYAQLDKKEIEELSETRARRMNSQPSIEEQQDQAEESTEPHHFLAETSPLLTPAPATIIMEEKDFDTNYESGENARAELSGKIAGLQITKQSKELDMTRTVSVASAPKLTDNYLTGRIVDATDNEPIIGASVAIKGTNQGTVTDVDGYFKLPVGSATEVDIIASYLGYETIEIPKPKNDMVLALKEDSRTLSEVVVSAYGFSKRSASTVKSDKKPESKPRPVIGEKEYKKYLENNMIKPESAGCKKGKVVLEFNVDKYGRPYNITVKKGLCEAYNNEAIRLLEEGSDWTSGTETAKLEVKF